MKIFSIKRIFGSTQKAVRDLSIGTLQHVANDPTDRRQAQARRELERRKKLNQRQEKIRSEQKLSNKKLDVMDSPVAK